jgi:hypothetical protein
MEEEVYLLQRLMYGQMKNGWDLVHNSDQMRFRQFYGYIMLEDPTLVNIDVG